MAHVILVTASLQILPILWILTFSDLDSILEQDFGLRLVKRWSKTDNLGLESFGPGFIHGLASLNEGRA